MQKVVTLLTCAVALTIAVVVMAQGTYSPQSREGGYVHETRTGSGNACTLTADVGSIEMSFGHVVTCAVGNARAEGQYLLIVNAVATNVVLNDSGNLELSGNTTLGQYDSILLYALQTSVWVEVAQANN